MALLTFVLLSVGAAALALLSDSTSPEWTPVREPENVRFHESRFDRKPDLFLSVSDPRVVPSSLATLNDDDEVLGLVVGDEERAYDVLALAYHHVVNDTVGGRPVAMTYCLICSSGIAFERECDGRALTFGYHGIWNGTAVLYDHQTDSKWLQISGECIEGSLKGQWLKPINCRHTVWSEWLAAHLDGTVMQTQREFADAYFPRSKTSRGNDFFPANFPSTMQYLDPRLPVSALCCCIRIGQETRAYPFSALAQLEGGVVNDVLGGTPVVVAFNGDTQSATALAREYNGETITFCRTADGYLKDLKTGQEFDLEGRPRNVEEASGLRKLYTLQSEWYGWAATWPETTIWNRARG